MIPGLSASLSGGTATGGTAGGPLTVTGGGAIPSWVGVGLAVLSLAVLVVLVWLLTRKR